MKKYFYFREESGIIPKFIVDHYEKTGLSKIPIPRVKSSRKVGSTVQHFLVYEDDPSLDTWVPLSNFTDVGDTVSQSCRTEKDKDKRTHRHTCGIFVGAWPCGIVVCFGELFGSEGKAQV